MVLTTEQLTKLLPGNTEIDKLLVILNTLLPRYDIDTVNRVSGFLAQCGHESGNFKIIKENLNYSSSGLRTVFPKYFKDVTTANNYERKPEKIANRVYANRMGNGTEASGDGYKYRGRGAIQLTGKDNYKAFATSINKSIDETIKYLETLEGAIESACWFWKKNGLNAICDKDDVVLMTKRINGGTIGLKERTGRYILAKKVLA